MEFHSSYVLILRSRRRAMLVLLRRFHEWLPRAISPCRLRRQERSRGVSGFERLTARAPPRAVAMLFSRNRPLLHCWRRNDADDYFVKSICYLYSRAYEFQVSIELSCCTTAPSRQSPPAGPYTRIGVTMPRPPIIAIIMMAKPRRATPKKCRSKYRMLVDGPSL